MKISGRSRSRLEGAFYLLLKEKPYDKITVSELIEKAGVSRSTFYRNYVDIYDMYDKVCTDFIEKLVTSAIIDSLKSFPEYNEKFFKRVCEIINSRKEQIFLLSGSNGDRRFFERGFGIAEKCLAFLGKTMDSEEFFKIRFVVYAGVGSYIRSMIKGEELGSEVVAMTKQILNL